jgi:hypothetical protein
MAKFYGPIGYAETVETSPGVWEEVITEHNYSCDMIKNTRRLQSANQLNDNVTISMEVSIIADPYATQNYLAMRYVKFMGTKWKISDVNIQYPRLILTLGGVYNGQ